MDAGCLFCTLDLTVNGHKCLVNRLVLETYTCLTISHCSRGLEILINHKTSTLVFGPWYNLLKVSSTCFNA